MISSSTPIDASSSFPNSASSSFPIDELNLVPSTSPIPAELSDYQTFPSSVPNDFSTLSSLPSNMPTSDSSWPPSSPQSFISDTPSLISSSFPIDASSSFPNSASSSFPIDELNLVPSTSPIPAELSDLQTSSISFRADGAPDRDLTTEEYDLLSSITSNFLSTMNGKDMQIATIEILTNAVSDRRKLQGKALLIDIVIGVWCTPNFSFSEELNSYMMENNDDLISEIKGDGGLGSVEGTFFFSTSIEIMADKPSSHPVVDTSFPSSSPTSKATSKATDVDPAALSGAVAVSYIFRSTVFIYIYLYVD